MAKLRSRARRRFSQFCKLAAFFLVTILIVAYLFRVSATDSKRSRPIVTPKTSVVTQHDFTVSHRPRIANGANAARDMTFTSTEFPMIKNKVPIVPNVVHFIKFRSTTITFIEMVTILAVHVNHRVEVIYVHCSLCNDSVTMGGHYWDRLLTYNPPVQVRYFPEPTKIFIYKIMSQDHASDIARMLILMEYGGIFLDNDVYVVKPLDEFLHYEMSLEWDEEETLSSHVLVAHRNARFLRLWYESYQKYDGRQEDYNARVLPTKRILEPSPYLVNRVKSVFGAKDYTQELYQRNDWTEWRNFVTIGLNNDDESDYSFDETTLKQLNCTINQMISRVLHEKTST